MVFIGVPAAQSGEAFETTATGAAEQAVAASAANVGAVDQAGAVRRELGQVAVAAPAVVGLHAGADGGQAAAGAGGG